MSEHVSSPADAAVAPARATHSGLVSVQEISIANLSEETRTLTVQALFTAALAPDYDESPGAPTGCKVWWYDVAKRPPPVEQDQGELLLDNLRGGDLRCHFVAGHYACEGLAERTLGEKLTFSGLDGGAFELPPSEVTPGAPFTIDSASRALIDALPLTAEGVTLSCEGAGGSCGAAAATIVRITATPAMALLARAHADSPLRRVRTAFMRDGVAVLNNRAPKPPNRLVLAAGRGLIGFTNR